MKGAKASEADSEAATGSINDAKEPNGNRSRFWLLYFVCFVEGVLAPLVMGAYYSKEAFELVFWTCFMQGRGPLWSRLQVVATGPRPSMVMSFCGHCRLSCSPLFRWQLQGRCQAHGACTSRHHLFHHLCVQCKLCPTVMYSEAGKIHSLLACSYAVGFSLSP